MMGASTRSRSAAADRDIPAADPTRNVTKGSRAAKGAEATQATKGKVVRRDPAKRREQNRQSQKTYREKQRKRIEELERRAAAAAATTATGEKVATPSLPTDTASLPMGAPQNPSHEKRSDDLNGERSDEATQSFTEVDDVIDPSILQSTSTDMISGFDISAFLPLDFDQWLLQDTLDHNNTNINLTSSNSNSNTDADIAISNHIHSHSHNRRNSRTQGRRSSGTPTIYFDCGCQALHIPMPFSPLLLPITPLLNPYINAMRLDVECTLDALLRNCLHLGIAKAQFCADEAESHFYRPLLPASTSSESSSSSSNSSGSPDAANPNPQNNPAIHANTPVSQPSNLRDPYTIPNEASTLLTRTHSIFRTLKHDLRPLSVQITTPHHPYIDVLPFRDVRENLIRLSTQDLIDEDEFLHDFFNHARCWGGPPKMGRMGARNGRGGVSVGVGEGSGGTVGVGVGGGSGSGSPWSARSWEVSDAFLWKWSEVVGGEDGELARSSMWWKSMRGEVVDEI